MSDKIKHVIVFNNGMCAVFNEKGEQIPELQGKWEEKYQEVFIRADDKTDIQMSAEWRKES